MIRTYEHERWTWMKKARKQNNNALQMERRKVWWSSPSNTTIPAKEFPPLPSPSEASKLGPNVSALSVVAMTSFTRPTWKCRWSLNPPTSASDAPPPPVQIQKIAVYKRVVVVVAIEWSNSNRIPNPPKERKKQRKNLNKRDIVSPHASTRNENNNNKKEM